MGLDTTLMELTPCKITFNGVDLGGTLDNVVVSVEQMAADLKADQTGETVLDKRVSGLVVKVKTKLTQIKDKSIWIAAFPFAVKHGGPVNYNIEMVNAVGSPYLANSKELILHPQSLTALDLSGDFKFGKALASAVSEIVFGPTEQQGLAVEWTIFPDTSVTPFRFFWYGDSSL